MASGEEEGIFQINDYTAVTEFEELTSKIELYMRGSGFSVDIRQHAKTRVSQKFSFHGFEFTCFHTANKKGVRTRGREPLAEVMEDEQEGYPLTGPPLTQLFGLTEFLVVMGKIPEKEEGAVLSAFAVGAQSAKCSLPVFLTKAEKTGGLALQCKGILSFPGYYATFEIWNIGKRRPKEEKYRFATDFHSLLSFFSQNISPNSSSCKAAICTAYRLAKSVPRSHSPQHFDLLKELVIYCKWQPRPAELLAACVPEKTLDPAGCDAMRVQVRLDAGRQYASGYFPQLEMRKMAVCGEVSGESLKRNTPEAVYFDEFLMMLKGVFPIFPINSLWTKAAIDLLISSKFSISSFHTFIETIRRRAENSLISIDFLSDFTQFNDTSELHQYLLTMTGALQSAHFIHTSEVGDPNSRAIFLHLSPARRQELQLIDAQSVPEYRQSLFKRVLKALLVDTYMEQGRALTVAEFIEWHKEMLREGGAYDLLSGKADDGQVIALWEAIAAESFSDVRTFVINELIKDMEIAAQQLEGLTTREIDAQLPGLCICAILALIFSQQVAFLSDSRTDSLLIPAVKDLIRPFFSEFLLTCKQMPSLSSMDSVVISELTNALRKLETSICTAFSLIVKLPAAPNLISKLLSGNDLEVTSEEEKREALGFIGTLSPDELWKTLVVLKSEKCRFTCLTEDKEVKIAVARVEKECPDSNSKESPEI